jgi:hypothetical protein
MDVRKLPAGAGSGFIWDKAGHVVTNFHVIEVRGWWRGLALGPGDEGMQQTAGPFKSCHQRSQVYRVWHADVSGCEHDRCCRWPLHHPTIPQHIKPPILYPPLAPALTPPPGCHP